MSVLFRSNLPRSRIRAGLVLALFACTGPSDPAAISARFELTDVDGLPLPVTAAPGVGTPGTVISGSVALDQLGGAITAEDRVDPTGNPINIRTGYRYVIRGSRIDLQYAFPCDCKPVPTATILNNGLNLQLTYGPEYTFHIYNYRVLAQD
jgi:hypothetical protein